jgi:hypothetical protein
MFLFSLDLAFTELWERWLMINYFVLLPKMLVGLLMLVIAPVLTSRQVGVLSLLAAAIRTMLNYYSLQLV